MVNKILKCVYLNLRSLRRCFYNFQTSIKEILDDINIIILVETNITDDEISFYKIQGFDSYFQIRTCRRGGGVALYIKSNIKHEILYPEDNAFESIVAVLNLGGLVVPVVAIYRPPALTNISTYINNLSNLIDNQKMRKNLLLIGDINLDLHKISRDTELYNDFINSKGLKTCNEKPTRVDVARNSYTNIDHILARIKDTKVRCGTVEVALSDHYPLFCAVEKNTCMSDMPATPEGKTVLNFKKINKLVQNYDWESIKSEKNHNLMYSKIVDVMENIYNKSKFHRNKGNRRRPYPWLNNDILDMCLRKERLYKSWKSKPYEKSKEKAYKVFKNLVTNQINAARNKYYQKMFRESSTDMKNTWKLVNEIDGKKELRALIPSSIISKKMRKPLLTASLITSRKELRVFYTPVILSCGQEMLGC